MTADIPGIRRFFQDQFASHGESAEGVGWNSTYAQDVRFEQLLKVVDRAQPFTMVEFGCGYGYLIDYMDQNGCKPDRYYGLDIVPESVEAAKTRFAGRQSCTFHLDPSEIAGADYLVASGVFNIKLDASNADWTEYVLENLKKFNAWTKKGFAVNFLTKYSDPERMALRPDLYYADPCELFDYCKRSFSRNVALLHDYEIYDFTLIVRKS